MALKAVKVFSFPQERQVINQRRPWLGLRSFYWVTDAGTIGAQVAAVRPQKLSPTRSSLSHRHILAGVQGNVLAEQAHLKM